MSRSMRLTRALVRVGTARTRRTPVQVQMARLPPEAERRVAPVPARLRRRLVVDRHEVAGQQVLTLVPRRGGTGAHLLYLHGGAYAHPLGRPHWWILDRLTRGTAVSVTVPLYRLLPEGDVTQAYELVGSVCDDLLSADRAVTLAGDSAGAALALGQAMARRDAGTRAPAQVVLLSPWLDATLSHPAVASLQRGDVVLQADRLRVLGRAWAGQVDPADPRVSPALGDLSGLPPLHVVTGGRDLLSADAADVVARVQAAGGRADLDLAPDGFHDHLMAWWTPEARRAFADVRALLR